MKRLLRAAAIVLSVAAGGVSYAQQAPSAPNTQPQPQAQTQAPAPAAAVPAPAAVSAETKAARAKLDGFKVDLDQKEAAIQGRTMPDADLQNTAADRADPTEIRTVIDEQAPKLEASRQRLSQLGPKPEKGQPEESADVAKDRAEREAAVAELDETQRLGRALLVQAEQLNTQIGDLRRAGFTRSLFEQSDGILSPSLWMNVVSAVPRELRALGIVLGDALEQLQRSTSLGVLLLLVSPSAWRSPFMSGGARSRRASSSAIPPSPIPHGAAAFWPRSACSPSARARPSPAAGSSG